MSDSLALALGAIYCAVVAGSAPPEFATWFFLFSGLSMAAAGFVKGTGR